MTTAVTTPTPTTSVVRLPQALGERVDIQPTVDSLRDLLLANEDRAEQDRRLPQEVVDALTAAGAFQTAQPREVGGVELHPLDYLDWLFEISRISGTVGWVLLFQKGNLPLLPSPVLAELKEKAGGRLLFGTSHSAVGRADRVEGGYRISGRYPFGTGTPWADYITAWADVWDENGEPVIVPETGAQLRIDAAIPLDEVTYLDDWSVYGLRGSGSGGFLVEDVYVEERFTTDGTPPEEYADRPFIVNPQAAEMGAVALGTAQGAIDRYIRSGSRAGKTPDPTVDELRMIRLGEADVKIRAARLLLWDTARPVIAVDDDQNHDFIAAQSLADPLAGELDFLISLSGEFAANSYAVQIAKEVANTILDIAGTDGIRVDRGIERAVRDITTGGKHPGNAWRNLSLLGQYLMTKDQPGGPTLDVPPPLR